MRKMLSFCIGEFDAKSRLPADSNSTTLPCRATMVTVPARRPESINSFIPLLSRARRSLDMPTLSGFAVGMSCVPAASAAQVKSAAQAAEIDGRRCMHCSRCFRHSIGIGNPHDTALRLGIIRIFDYRYVQVLLAGAERHIGRAVAGGDLEKPHELPIGGYLEDLSAGPLGDIHIALVVDLHAIRADPPGIDFVWRQDIEQREIRSVTERTIAVHVEFQYAISHRLADVQCFLVRGNADTIGIVEIVRDLDPLLAAGREIENLSGHRRR